MPPGVMLKEFSGYRSQTGKHSIKSTKFIIYYGGIKNDSALPKNTRSDQSGFGQR